MTLTVKDTLEYLSGGRLPNQRATSQHLSAVNPMTVESPLIDARTGRKVIGLPIGFAGREGTAGVFGFDPFQFHQAKRPSGISDSNQLESIIHNLNAVVLGKINKRKSSLVKHIVYMAAACGYNCLVTDLKGEYGALVESVYGARELKFGEDQTDTKLVVNVLDRHIPEAIQFDLISALALTTIGRSESQLDVEEKSLLKEAIRAAKQHGEGREHGWDGRPANTAVLEDLIDVLFEPTGQMAADLHETQIELRRTGRPLALGLRELTKGELKGMVDGPTSAGFFDDTPLLVLNCSGLQDSALAVMVIVLNYLTASQFGKSNALGRFHWVFHDESWRLAAFPAFIMSLRTAFKLGRSEGVANWIVFHHLENLWRSSQQSIVKDLIGDADTRIIYDQDPAELALSREALNLTQADMDRIPGLPPGTAIWKIGKETIEVRHEIEPELLHIVENSGRVLGRPA